MLLNFIHSHLKVTFRRDISIVCVCVFDYTAKFVTQNDIFLLSSFLLLDYSLLYGLWVNPKHKTVYGQLGNNFFIPIYVYEEFLEL